MSCLKPVFGSKNNGGDVIVYVEVDQILFCYHGDVGIHSYMP